MSSIAIYLWFNAVLYAAFTIWCLLRPTATAAFSGLSLLNTSGRSEYFALYVGLEGAWALLFALCALKPEWQFAGMLNAVFIYAGLICGRWISILQKGVASSNTYYIAALEVGLGIWGILLFLKM